MIVRDLYRCSPEDLHHAIAGSGQTVVRWGALAPASELGPEVVEYLVRHPDFDPSLSFVAYDGGEPVAYLVSRIEGDEAQWSLFGGAAEHGLELVLEDAMSRWRSDGATRARKGLTGLLGSEPRLAEDAELIAVLKARGFAVTSASAHMSIDLKRLPSSSPVDEREAELRRKGYMARPARPDETAVVARQFQPRSAGIMGQEHWNHFIRHLRPEGVVVVEHRRQLLGFGACLCATLDGESPAVGPVFVDALHRDMGLDGVLLRQLLRLLKEAGKAQAEAVAEADRVAFYERAGFTVVARLCHAAEAELE